MSDATISIPTSETNAAARPASRTPARVVLAALALLAIGGGWYGYQHVRGTAGIPMAKAGDFLPDSGGPRVGFDGRVRPAPNADGVNVLPGNVVVARAGGLTMRANARVDGKWQLTFARGPGGAAAAAAGDRQAVELVNQTRRRILDPRRPQADLKVTDPQRATLATAAPEAPPELAADAFARATDLLGQLTKLPPTDAKAEPLKAELQQVVATVAKVDPTTIAREYESRAAKIRATLSAEQVQALLDLRPARPTVAPATKPTAK